MITKEQFDKFDEICKELRERSLELKKPVSDTLAASKDLNVLININCWAYDMLEPKERLLPGSTLYALCIWVPVDKAFSYQLTFETRFDTYKFNENEQCIRLFNADGTCVMKMYNL